MGNSLYEKKKIDASFTIVDSFYGQKLPEQWNNKRELLKNKCFATYMCQLQSQNQYIIVKIYHKEKDIQNELLQCYDQFLRLRQSLPTTEYYSVLPYSQMINFEANSSNSANNSFVAVHRQGTDPPLLGRGVLESQGIVNCRGIVLPSGY